MTRAPVYWPGYALIALGVLRVVFPVERCLAGEGFRMPLNTLYLPWQHCEFESVVVRIPLASITIVQAFVFLMVGMGWLAWKRWR